MRKGRWQNGVVSRLAGVESGRGATLYRNTIEDPRRTESSKSWAMRIARAVLWMERRLIGGVGREKRERKMDGFWNEKWTKSTRVWRPSGGVGSGVLLEAKATIAGEGVNQSGNNSQRRVDGRREQGEEWSGR